MKNIEEKNSSTNGSVGSLKPGHHAHPRHHTSSRTHVHALRAGTDTPNPTKLVCGQHSTTPKGCGQPSGDES